MTKTELFIKKARKIHYDKWDYSNVTYLSSNKKVVIICPKHGNFEQTPHGHLSGRGCDKCGGTFVLNDIDFINRSNKIHNNRYNYNKVNYTNNRKKVTIICYEHGEFEQIPSDHLMGKGCKKCSIKTQIERQIGNKQEFIEKAEIKHGKFYDYSQIVYKDSYSKVDIICPLHGSFLQKANNHLNGDGCPNCCSSKGELAIRNWLENNKINYISQKTFPDCKNPKTNYKLRYDFYIPHKNILIEFDGIQHFKIGKIRGKHNITPEEFENIQYKDKIKNEYAKSSGMHLIRIPYTEIKSIPSIMETVNNPKNA